VKINGSSSGSVTLAAPASGSDVTLTLPGTAGTVALASANKILQIVRATDTTRRTTTSTSFADASLSVTITPSAITSNIILIATYYAECASNDAVKIAITDSGNTAISAGEYGGVFSGSGVNQVAITKIAYASPASTSAVTYKIRYASNSGGSAVLYNDLQTGQLLAIEVSV